MRTNPTVEQYRRLCNAKLRGLRRVAERLGKDHPMTKMMGGLAWGRHEMAPGHGQEKSLRAAAEEFGALEGYVYILSMWGRDNDEKAQRVLIDEVPRGYGGMNE